ncbi:hypothetical protein F3Y22_tig00112536pilonHSYRG00016 [Hibiscus syriacus]|uniref:DUF3741 domain-containing protein n=1 Tax=Hibiscus syriacus TaxID=106335 RepID=A0A6A2Y1P1_HIBSY|nr:uncharacterized protein LOC120181822 [Hibiscus syriacus]KAE8665589.1 hypothetical protein F3Y22_tig00112536pilonHSYRG00016 [Hibiscus syriacus]
MERKSSSCRRRRNSIGCMPAIFSFFTKNHKRSKFITRGKERRKEAADGEERPKDAKLVIRSPTLPVEMRRSLSVEVGNHRHALVARLMGVDKFPPPLESSSVADERVSLQQVRPAEKCDEDLKALQRIIEVVKTSIGVGFGECNELRGRRSLQQKHQVIKKKAEEEDIAATASSGEISFLRRFTTEHVAYAKSNNNDEGNDSVSSMRRSALAMMHSVHQVCKDIAWGERREIGIIGLALQQNIFRDLIHELVQDIACYSN